MQRREAALVHVLRARFLDDLAFPLIDLAVIVQVRVLRREELHHVGLALRGGPHDRGLSAPGFLRVDVGSRGKKRLGRVNLAAARGSHQRSFAVRSPEIGIGAGLEQRVDDRRGADDRGFGDRRRAQLVLQFDIRAGFDQRADEFQIVVRRGVHDGGGAIGAGGVYVRAFDAREAHGRGMIARFGSVKKTRAIGQYKRSARQAGLRMRPQTCACLNLRKTVDAVADGFHRDLIALQAA